LVVVVVVVAAVVGMERVVEPLPPVAGGADDDVRVVPLGAWVGETLPGVAVGVPGTADVPDVPGGDEVPSVVDGVSVAALAAVTSVGLGDFVVMTAIPTAMTTVTTTAAQTPRCANNRRLRTITLRLPFSR